MISDPPAEPGSTRVTPAVQRSSRPPVSLLGTARVTWPESPSPGTSCSPGPVRTYAASRQMCQTGRGRPSPAPPGPGTVIQISPARLVASAMRANRPGPACFRPVSGWVSLTQPACHVSRGGRERMASPYRPRRTCLAVPGSSPRFLEKARGLPVDEVFLDLEDAVAPGAKPAARAAVVEALNGGGWEGKIRAVRVNDATTPWAYRDVIEVVEGAGPNLDVIILPKASEPAQVTWLDLLLSQVGQA